MNNIRVNDVGTLIKLQVSEDDVVLDISAATGLQFIFEKPDRTTVTKSALFLTDGTDGMLYYETIAGDIDLPGWWRVQAAFTLGGWIGKSSVEQFYVEKNIG